MSDPNKPTTPLATGGMSREGTTTIVKINEPEIDALDKKVLCSTMCRCDLAPKIGKDGQQLKQAGGHRLAQGRTHPKLVICTTAPKTV